MIKSGNKIWFNQALYYFHFNRNSGTFCREFNYIRKEIGLLIKHNKPNLTIKDDNT